MKNLYSIFDSFLDEFLPPFVAKNNNIAQLSYEEFLKIHSLHKGQITKLFCVGTFDENKGTVSSLDIPVLVKAYYDVKEKEKK